MEGAALRFMLMALAGWWSDQRQAAVAYLIEENRVLRAQLHGRRVRPTDEDRCRLARAGHRLGRRLLRQVATIVTPDTILRWHRHSEPDRLHARSEHLGEIAPNLPHPPLEDARCYGIRHDIISPRERVLPSDTRDTKVARDVPLK